jgi:hypothetical protein
MTGFNYFDNTNSSGNPFDPVNCAIGGLSRWLTLVPQMDGMMSIDTIGSEVATVVAVYRGSRTTDLISPNFVACDVSSAADGHSLIRFKATNGIAYSILVDSLNAERGKIFLHYCLGTVPVVTANTATSVVAEGGTLSLIGSVSGGDPPPVYQWYRNGAAIAGATGAEYSRNNFGVDATGVYSLVASNCLGISSNVVGRVTVEVPLHVNFLASSQGGVFQFQVYGSASHPFVVQYTTNFLNWIPVVTNATPYAPMSFTDSVTGNRPIRVFRAIPWP